MNGTHYSDTLLGRVFSQAATPLGLAIPIYSATAIVGGMPIWNPPGSGINVELVRVDIGYGSGTAVYGSIGLMAGSVNSIATASGCSAFATTTPLCGLLLGTGAGSKVASTNAGTVTVTAGVATPPVLGVAGAGWTRTLYDINLEAQTGTAHGTSGHTYDFDGTVVIPPGVLVYLACTQATSALYATTIVWKEMPIRTA